MLDIDAVRNSAFISLKEDEGYSQFPAADTGNTLVIGYGLNINLEGVTKAEAAWLLNSKINQCVADLVRALPWFADLDVVRQAALVNMRYNLGMPRLSKFKKMLAALKIQDWKTAAKECLDSDAARSLPNRYGRLANILRGGVI